MTVVDDHRTRRGGLGRPVGVSGTIRASVAAVALAGWLGVLAGTATAHGGTPTLQLNSDQVNPGGTIELRGDMTGDDPVELTLQAGDGSTLTVGVVETDSEGHFVWPLAIPVDVAPGTYIVRVASPFEEATTRIVVAGAPLRPADDPGQPLGRDEARAGAIPGASDRPNQPPTRWRPPAGADSTGNVIAAAIVVAVIVVAVLGLGGLARMRARRS